MRHLRTYKLFEGEIYYGIDDKLEFEVGDEVWVNSHNGYEWKDIPCQIMDIKVGTDVAGSPHNEIKVYFYYVRNSETEEIRPFRSFKLSKIENGVNESTAYDDMKNIIEDINNMCDDLRDDGFVIDIKPDNDIAIKMLGLYRRGSVTSLHTTKIEVGISKSDFILKEIYESTGRIYNYMKSENFDCNVEFVTSIANRAASVSMRRPISKKTTYVEFVKLFNIGGNKLSSIKMIFEIDPIYLLDVINQRDR